MKVPYGRLLCEGKSDMFRMRIDISYQKKLFMTAIVALPLVTGIALWWVILTLQHPTPTKIIHIVSLTIPLLIGWFLLPMIPLSKDVIYEKGITAFHHSLLDTIRGYNFHSWQNISRIEFGEHIDKMLHKTSEYIILYEKSRPKATTIIEGSDYVNDFMEKLKESLKKNCPHAVWVEGPTIDWFPLRNQWKYFNEGKHYVHAKRG